MDTIGLNLLSELTVSPSKDFMGIAFTQQFVGLRRGVLRPNRFLLVSPVFWQAYRASGMKGLDIEVAHYAAG